MCNERTMVTKKGAADLDRWLNSGHQEPIFGFGSKTFPPKFQKNFRAVFFSKSRDRRSRSHSRENKLPPKNS